MNIFDRIPKLRWLVPVVAGAVLVGGGATITAVTASAGAATLTPRSAAQLLVDVQQAQLGSLSGTIVQSADLGLPSLPGIGGASSSDLTSLISGTHTLRVWYDGADKARVALLGTLGESDVIKNGNDVWIWSSQENTADHRVISTSAARALTANGTTGAGIGTGSGALPSDLPSTPQDAAAAVLRAIDPTTTVTTDVAQTVAGRSVYQLVLQPKQTGSLISRVTVAIDAEKRLPLRVQVFAVGRTDPAFEVAFTSVDFSAPDPAQFTFNPPPGAKVTEPTADPADGTARTAVPRTGPAAPRSVPASTSDEPTMVGTGWTTVAIAKNPMSGSAAASAGPRSSTSAGSDLTGVLQALPEVSGTWGSGHLLSGTLFSAVLTDDGRIAVGAVAPELLYRALEQK